MDWRGTDSVTEMPNKTFDHIRRLDISTMFSSHSEIPLTNINEESKDVIYLSNGEDEREDGTQVILSASRKERFLMDSFNKKTKRRTGKRALKS